MNIYVTEREENLCGIAHRRYGRREDWRRVQASNPGIDGGLDGCKALKQGTPVYLDDDEPRSPSGMTPVRRVFSVTTYHSATPFVLEDLEHHVRQALIAKFPPGTGVGDVVHQEF